MARAGGGALEPGPSEPAADEAANSSPSSSCPSASMIRSKDGRSSSAAGSTHSQEHGDSPAGLVEALSDRRLQELVGKAIEMSTVASLWERAA